MSDFQFYMLIAAIFTAAGLAREQGRSAAWWLIAAALLSGIAAIISWWRHG